jgi:site-specific recombinase XerD
VPERLEDLSASFRRHLRAEGKADRTGLLYSMSVKFFAEWLAVHERPATLDELTRSAIREWLADLTVGRAPGTVRTRWKGLHRFCSWLIAEGEISEHPMRGLSVPKLVDTPVPVLADDELAALLKACQGPRFYDRRDEAVVRMLLDCGLRVSELCGLTTGDVDVDREMAIVTGKGRKVRPVYFGARTSRALDRYKRIRRQHRWAHADALFLGERGPLTPDGVREILRLRGEAAGIKDRLHPHRLRHTWAHDFLMAGGGERDLKRLAGWSSDTMLERYGSSAADVRAREAARRLRRGDRV